MVTHSECEISQSLCTQFSSHGAFNLNHADMPPPPLLDVVLSSSLKIRFVIISSNCQHNLNEIKNETHKMSIIVLTSSKIT